MRQIVDKVDSEAPGFKFCVRCETRVDEALSECPECGAPLEGLRLIENISDTVHADLARANLFRMRGEHKEAEQQCLAVLRRYPHHFETHVLLGDIFAEQQAYEQAAQWLELAIDLDPGSFIARQKLQVARDRVREIETKTSVDQLGLPPNNGARTIAYAVFAVALISICGFIAFSLGQKNPRLAGDTVRSPISATQDTLASPPITNASKEEEPASTQHSEPVVQPPMSAEEKATTELLRKGEHGDRLVVASLDPRSKALTITYRIADGDVDRRIGAEIARDALAAMAEAPMVTVKGLKGDKLAFMADIDRNRLAMTQTQAWQSSATGPDAWIGYVVSNEWYAVTPPPAEPATESTTGT